MSQVRYIDPLEFQQRGYLQEVNRLFLHPLGLALEITQLEEGGPWTFRGVWDARDDPEGWAFTDGPSPEKAAAVEAERQAKVAARLAGLGWEIQPPGVGLPPEGEP